MMNDVLWLCMPDCTDLAAMSARLRSVVAVVFTERGATGSLLLPPKGMAHRITVPIGRGSPPPDKFR